MLEVVDPLLGLDRLFWPVEGPRSGCLAGDRPVVARCRRAVRVLDDLVRVPDMRPASLIPSSFSESVNWVRSTLSYAASKRAVGVTPGALSGIML